MVAYPHFVVMNDGPRYLDTPIFFVIIYFDNLYDLKCALTSYFAKRIFHKICTYIFSIVSVMRKGMATILNMCYYKDLQKGNINIKMPFAPFRFRHLIPNN